MIYRLIGRAGAIKNCFKREAQELISSGDWLDITKYKDEDKQNENKSIFKDATKQAIESRQSSGEREGCGLQCAGNTKTNGIADIFDGRNSETIQKDEVTQPAESEMPRKKRRGRPPKIKGSDDATNSTNNE